MKAGVAADIGSQVRYVDVAFVKQLRIGGCKVFYADGFGLRDIRLLREYPRETVDEHRLPACLPVEIGNHFWCEGLPHFVGVLSKEFLHLVEGEVRQVELVLDIKRRDGPVVVELCDIFHTDDADAVRAPMPIREINAAERVQKITHCRLWNAIKLINNEDNALVS